MTLTLTPLSGISIIRKGDVLSEILLSSLATSNVALQDGDILVLAQKIVSKAEGRMVNLASVTPGKEAVRLAARTGKEPRLVELILKESNEVLRVREGTIIVEHHLGFVCANAGIDHSNVAGRGDATEEYVLLLPENPDRSANEIRKEIETKTGVRLGIAIIDSHGRAWRR